MNRFSKILFSSAVLSAAQLFTIFVLTTQEAMAGELKVTDSVVGTGIEAVPGKAVLVHYDGYLSDKGEKGKKFDSSHDRGQPFSFKLGSHQVIEGWEQGVKGMKIGGKRTLIIPPDLGYGARGAGGVIPPNAELIFDVELLDVK